MAWKTIRNFHLKWRFLTLLTTLLTLLLLPTMLHVSGLRDRWFNGLFALVMLATVLSLSHERRQRFFSLVLGIPTLFVALGTNVFGGWQSSSILVAHLASVVFLFGSATLIVRVIFHLHAVSADSIFGAVCGYLLLGVGWGVLYDIIDSVNPGSFHMTEEMQTQLGTGPDTPLLYFSFVTLTTVGYGDVTPATSLTRTCAWLEAITGQFYIAVVVAGLVSVLITRAITQHDRPRDGGPHKE